MRWSLGGHELIRYRLGRFDVLERDWRGGGGRPLNGQLSGRGGGRCTVLMYSLERTCYCMDQGCCTLAAAAQP